MPKKKRWAYRCKQTGIFQSKKNVTQINIPYISPNCNGNVAVTESLKTDPKKGRTTMQWELKGLSMNERQKQTYVPKDSGNRVVHWDSLQRLVCENTKCKSCGHDVKLSETTVGIATQIQLVCKNVNCDLKKN